MRLLLKLVFLGYGLHSALSATFNQYEKKDLIKFR
jgi:hypothetical protein